MKLIIFLLAILIANFAIAQDTGIISTKSTGHQTDSLSVMAASGSKSYAKILSNAAKETGYRQDASGAMKSYLKYAERLGAMGNIKLMAKICREIINKADNNSSVQYKSSALSILMHHKGKDALGVIINSFSDRSDKYRTHGLSLAEKLKGAEVTKSFLASYAKLEDEYRPDVLEMLGKRGDRLATQTIRDNIKSSKPDIRKAALTGLTSLLGKEVLPDIIQFISSKRELYELDHAFALLAGITGSKERDTLASRYSNLPELSKPFTLILLANGGEAKYFDMLIGETDSYNELLRNAAFVSLANVSTEKDIKPLLALLEKCNDKHEIKQVQLALAQAISYNENEDNGVDMLIKTMEDKALVAKIIPILPKLGNESALSVVHKEFIRGDENIQAICFDALTSWKDHTASVILFEICKSNTHLYRRATFEGYVRLITTARIAPEQRLHLLKKIMPYAEYPEQKIKILNNIANVHNIQALLFASKYLDDEGVKQTAAQVIMGIAVPATNSSSGIYDDSVKDVLMKVHKVLQGDDSVYAKKRIEDYLNKMTDDSQK